MAAELILTSHGIFGILGTLAGMWVFVEILNADHRNSRIMYSIGIASAVFMRLSFLFGGYWYVSFYGVDRDVVLDGPNPWAHEGGNRRLKSSLALPSIPGIQEMR